jgi:hypothetical protein
MMSIQIIKQIKNDLRSNEWTSNKSVVSLKESLDLVRVPLRFDTAANIVEEEFQVHVPLTHDDHVV